MIAELRRAVPRLPDPVMFPVKVRVAAADDIWLSTAYGRESAYVAIHQYAGLPYRAYFDRFESIAAEVAAGRTGASSTHSTPNVSVRFIRAMTSSAGSAPRSTPKPGSAIPLTRVLGDVTAVEWLGSKYLRVLPAYAREARVVRPWRRPGSGNWLAGECQTGGRSSSQRTMYSVYSPTPYWAERHIHSLSEPSGRGLGVMPGFVQGGTRRVAGVRCRPGFRGRQCGRRPQPFISCNNL